MSTNSGSASAEGTRGYEEAITALNSLQTNAKALADQRKTGGRDLAKALSDVQAYAKRMELQDVELNGLRAIHVAGSKVGNPIPPYPCTPGRRRLLGCMDAEWWRSG
jgi:hypothetical protein